jgi:predicted Zn-dependent protease
LNYRFTWTWITALSFCLAGGCAASAPTRTGESATAAAPAANVGRSEDSDLVAAFGGQYDSPPLSAYVNEVGNRVAAHCGDHSGAALTFTVLDTPIVNALNGGHGDVYITRGMLSVVNSEDELAGILAHQIGHLESTREESNQPSAKPGNQNPENQAPILRDLQVPALRFVIPHSNDHEYQVDVVAVQCLASAGYDPRATARLLESIRNFERASAISIGRKPDSVNRLDYLATHAGAIEQYDHALGQMPDRKIAASNHDGYLPHLDGMLYDNRGEFGVVRGLSFARPGWHVRFGMIKGFQILPQREHVFVIGSSGAFGVMDMAPEPPTGPLSDYIANVWAKGPLELTKLRAGMLRGMEAASAEASVSSPNGTAKLWIFVVRLDPSHVFRVRVHSSAPVNRYDLYAYLKMISTIGTVPETWSVYQLRQIKVVDVQNGDTMASMARRCAFSVEGEEFFRALNGLGARDTLPVRARVKLVVEQK